MYFDVGELSNAFPLLRSVEQVASISQREWLLLLLAEVEERIEREEEEAVWGASCVESFSFLVVELFRLSASCVQHDNAPAYAIRCCLQHARGPLCSVMGGALVYPDECASPLLV